VTDNMSSRFGDTSVEISDIEEAVQFAGISVNGTLTEIITVPISLATGEQTATKIFFPYKVTVNKIRGIVMKAIAAVDNGTIQGANSTGNSAAGLITATASDALNVEYSVSPTSNNIVSANSYYILTSAKATAGGKVLVSLEVTRMAT